MRETYASMTWTTPLLTKTSVMTTLALFTKTVPLMAVMVMLPPPSVVRVVLVTRSLYRTRPGTTW